MKNDCDPNCSPMGGVPREPAIIEVAMERLDDLLNNNRALSEQIYSRVFYPRPVAGGCDPNKIIKECQEMTLAEMIH